MKSLLGWHFLEAKRCLKYFPYTKVEVGEKLTIKPPIKLCVRGFHACRKPLDALYYAPGPIVCRVRLSGQIIEDTDKAVASERTVLWMADATVLLREFTRWCDPKAWTRDDISAWIAAPSAAWSAAWITASSAAYLAYKDVDSHRAAVACRNAEERKQNEKLGRMLQCLKP